MKTKKNTHREPQSSAIPMRLSLSMIVKNEEARLAECLESMKSVADEMVIVDTGSTDRTREIAQAFGARVFEFPWNGSFCDARNASLDRCTGDWVIFLDADERLDPASAPLLRHILDDTSVTAYELIVASRTVDERKNLASVFGYNPRLFRRREDLRFQYRIHESILPAVSRAGGRVGRADVTIHHIGYDGTQAEMQQKFHRNLVPLRLDAEEYPDDLFVLEKLAQTEMILRNDARAESALARVLELLEAGAAGSLYASKSAHVCNLFSELCLWTNRVAEAEAYALRSLAHSARQYQAHALLSRIYERQERYAEALAAVGRLLELSTMRPPFRSDVQGDCNVLEEDILYKQALLYKKQGRVVAEIKTSLLDALRANAGHRAAQAELSAIYAGEGDFEGILRTLSTLPRTEVEHAGLLFLRGQALARSGAVPEAIADLWAAFTHGLHQDELIFLLVRLLNEQQRQAETAPLYEAYLSRHPQADDARMLLLQLYQQQGRNEDAARFAAVSLTSIVSPELKAEFARIAAAYAAEGKVENI